MTKEKRERNSNDDTEGKRTTPARMASSKTATLMTAKTMIMTITFAMPETTTMTAKK